jgi:hypothetical protein
LPAVVVQSEFLLCVVDELDVQEGKFVGLDLVHHILVGDEVFFACLDHVLLGVEVVPAFVLEVGDHVVVVCDEAVAEVQNRLLVSRCPLYKFPKFPIHPHEEADEVNVELLVGVLTLLEFV